MHTKTRAIFKKNLHKFDLDIANDGNNLKIMTKKRVKNNNNNKKKKKKKKQAAKQTRTKTYNFTCNLFNVISVKILVYSKILKRE